MAQPQDVGHDLGGGIAVRLPPVPAAHAEVAAQVLPRSRVVFPVFAAAEGTGPEAAGAPGSSDAGGAGPLEGDNPAV